MDNPIRFSDLFGEDIQSGLDALIAQVGQVESSILSMLKDVKKEASGIADALSGTSSATKGDRDATSQYAAEIERLHAENEKLVKSLDSVQKQLKNMKDAKNKDKNETVNLAQSYESLADLIKETGVNVEELLKSDRQLSIAKKNGETANGSLAGSYDKLYAQYNLIKNVLNAMGEEMRNNEAVGKKWEAQALSLMNTMKGMQEATGKHILSVGDYSKALNGLNISTQQILREMPTIANSWSQFFMAISNNVPIFTDAVKRVVAETGSWQIAMKGILTSLFSWQTALLVVLTILPKVAKNIHDKKKAQEEENRVLQEAITLTEIHRKTLLGEGDAISNQTGKIKELYEVMLDLNRSEQDRISAMEAIQRLTKIQISDINDTSQAVADYISMLDKQAIAEEKIARILNLKAEIREADAKIGKIEETKQYQKALEGVAEAQAAYNAQVRARKNEEYLKASQGRILAARALEKERLEDLQKAEEKLSNLTNVEVTQKTRNVAEIERLQKELTADLIDTLDTETHGTKENLDKQKDYYWEFLESKARIIKDEEDRELELNAITYAHKIETLKNELAERKKAGTLNIQQEEYINGIIDNLAIEANQKRWEIIWKWYDKTWNAVKDQFQEEVKEETIDEEDLSISGRYEKILAENAKKLLASREKLNTALEQGSYREAKEEGKAFKDLTIEKLKLEEELQEALLKMRLETGTITADQYEIELANLQTALAKNIANLSKKRKGKFDLATMLFGDIKEDGKGNVYKELTADAQAFVGAFEQAMSSAFEYMDEWMDKRIEMAEIAVEAAEKESDAAKTALDYEMEARANGYANNVELARKEYEEKLQLERDAIAEKERLEKIQEGIDSATQLSSLITATAELWAAHASIPFAGTALAIAATAAMWGSFAAAKIQAAQLTATKYGEGMSEYLDYGGSHASGNDIDFGADKNGRRRRVERGEMIGVINKRNVEKYGVSRITDIIQSLNKGTFENKYSSVVDAVIPEMNADLYHLAFAGLEREMAGTDLGRVESSLQTLVEQGETKVVTTPYGRIEYKGNNKRIIRNS